MRKSFASIAYDGKRQIHSTGCAIQEMYAGFGDFGVAVLRTCLVLSAVSPCLNASSEGLNLAFASFTKCSAFSLSKNRGNRYVLQHQVSHITMADITGKLLVRV